MEKVIKINLTLSNDGYSWSEVIWDIKETSKIYVLKRKDENDGVVIERRMPKDDLNKIIRSLLTNYSNISYSCITTLDNIEQTKEKLLEKVNYEALECKKILNKTLSFIKNENSLDIKNDNSFLNNSKKIDELAEAIKNEFGESIIEDGDEKNPYDWWLTDVTVTDIIDFLKKFK